MIIILIKLLLAHIIGDFVLQPKSWVEEKEVKKEASPKLYFHALIHGLLVLLLVWDLSLWLLALLIAILHFGIDLMKLRLQKQSNKVKWFIADQLLHLLVIVMLWSIWFSPEINIAFYLQDPVFWLYITAILFLTTATGIIMQILLAHWSVNLSDGQDESLANAGKYIGILERLFVFTFIVSGHWEAVGFLIAAKSVFRFGDMRQSKDRKLTEYILIGTLLSFGIAIATGMIVIKVSTMI